MSSIVAGSSLPLTKEEEALFALLLEVVANRGLKCILRVAGGWVRDKILGGNPHDIDIAIDDRMGKEFAEELVGYMRECGRAAEVGSVGVIKSNPDQSKHLETATVRVLGLEIDFVNLRAEEYTDSRIPVMRIGTAEEDALRRDLTINSLFYNINKSEVEDFTGRGITDLQQGIVQTPLPPMQTMIDDPLRALRAVRFATRFSFSLHQDLHATISSQQVRDALSGKVSKERVRTELTSMLNGPNPSGSLALLLSVSLLNVVFEPPSLPDLPPSWSNTAHAALQQCTNLPAPVVQSLLALPPIPDAAAPPIHALPKEHRRLLFLSLPLLPLRSFSVLQGKKSVPAPEHVIRVSLKSPIQDVKDTCLVLNAVDELSHVLLSSEPDLDLKERVGRCLKQSGALWRLGLVLVVCERLQSAAAGAELREIERVVELERRICARWNLDGVWELKALVNGTEVCELLGLDIRKDGKQIGEIHRELAGWVLRQPSPLHVTKDQCQHWLQTTFAPNLKRARHGDDTGA